MRDRAAPTPLNVREMENGNKMDCEGGLSALESKVRATHSYLLTAVGIDDWQRPIGALGQRCTIMFKFVSISLANVDYFYQCHMYFSYTSVSHTYLTMPFFSITSILIRIKSNQNKT